MAKPVSIQLVPGAANFPANRFHNVGSFAASGEIQLVGNRIHNKGAVDLTNTAMIGTRLHNKGSFASIGAELIGDRIHNKGSISIENAYLGASRIHNKGSIIIEGAAPTPTVPTTGATPGQSVQQVQQISGGAPAQNFTTSQTTAPTAPGNLPRYPGTTIHADGNTDLSGYDLSGVKKIKNKGHLIINGTLPPGVKIHNKGSIEVYGEARIEGAKIHNKGSIKVGT